MKYNRIVLAGGSGYLGSVLAAHFSRIAEEVIILSRTPRRTTNNIRTIVWDGRQQGAWIHGLEEADLLVNLCGKNVNCRYNERNKQEILRSRIEPTELLGQVIGHLKQPPALWINVTSATIYRHAEDRAQDEKTGEEGHGFSVDICRQWEEAFFKTLTPRTRKIALRMGIVLGRKDGVFPRLLNLVKYGLGGKQGSGSQFVSWIHEQDAAHCVEWLTEQPALSGIINCTAPNAVSNRELMALIRKTSGKPIGLPSPAWLLEVGAVVIGTETELILKSRWVTPKRLLDAGYRFHFPAAAEAVQDIMAPSPL